MCTCTVLTFISWSLTGLYLITRSTCLAFRPDILDFKIVCLSIQRKKILFVTNYAQLSILKLFSAVLSIRTSFRNTFYLMNITGIVSSLEGDEATQMKFKRIVATVFSEEGGGGGGRGWSQPPTSHTPFSRLPYLFVPFSPDSRPLARQRRH